MPDLDYHIMRIFSYSLFVVTMLVAGTLAQPMMPVCSEGCQGCTLKMGYPYCEECVNSVKLNGQCRELNTNDVIPNCWLQSDKRCYYCKEGYSMNRDRAECALVEPISDCISQSHRIGVLNQRPTGTSSDQAVSFCQVCKRGVPSIDLQSCISFEDAERELRDREMRRSTSAGLSQGVVPPSPSEPSSPWDISSEVYPWNKREEESTPKIDTNLPYIWDHKDSSLPWNQPQKEQPKTPSIFENCMWGWRDIYMPMSIDCVKCVPGYVLLRNGDGESKCVPENEKTEGCWITTTDIIGCLTCNIQEDFYMKSPGVCAKKNKWVNPF